MKINTKRKKLVEHGLGGGWMVRLTEEIWEGEGGDCGGDSILEVKEEKKFQRSLSKKKKEKKL